MALFVDTVFYSIANWGRRIIGFIVAPVMIAYFSPEEYGFYTLVNTLASFFSIIGLLALVDQGLPRFILDTSDLAAKQAYISTAYLVSAIGVATVILIIIASAPIASSVFESIPNRWTFTGLIALTCLSQSVLYVGSNMLKWTFRSAVFAKITIVQSVVGALLTIAGIVLWQWRAPQVLLATAVIIFCAGVWANYYTKDDINASAISRDKFKELFLYSWPLLGLNVFAFFTRSLDRIFLGSMATLEELGIFSVSYAVAGLFETAVIGFFFAWGPHVLSTFREDDAPLKYANYFSLLSFLGIISIIVLGLWGSQVVMLFRRDGAYAEINVYIPWILSGAVLYYLGGYFAPGPSIRKKTYLNFIGFLLAASCNALLNYLLIPKYKILGAGIATTVSSFIAALFLQVVSNRLYYVPNRYKTSFALIIMATAAVSMAQMSNFEYNINNISFLLRAVLTLFFIFIAIIPYYRDIRESEFVMKAVARISKFSLS